MDPTTTTTELGMQFSRQYHTVNNGAQWWQVMTIVVLVVAIMAFGIWVGRTWHHTNP